MKKLLYILVSLALLTSAGFAVAATLNKTPAITNTLNNDLVGWWTFDGADTFAGSIADKSGNNNTGTRTSVTMGKGKIGQGGSFNGSTSRVSMGTISSLNGATSLTLSTWVKQSSFTANQRIFSKGAANDFLFQTITPNNFRFFLNNIVSSSTASGLVANKWNHIAVTWTAGTTNNVKFYLNGNLVLTTNNYIPSVNPVGGVLVLGNFTGSDNSVLNGTMDDARVWTRALSAKEILQLYQMGK